MKQYTFTREIRTPIWFNILRHFNLKPRRHDFKELLDVDLYDHGYRIGDTIDLSGTKLKIVKL